jgi:peptide/nickel transport system substrate-binding protein
VTQQVDRFLYDSLVNIDENGKMVPGLARELGGDHHHREVHLRKNVSCSDGTPLTASVGGREHQLRGRPQERVVPHRRLRAAGRDREGRRRGRHGRR